MSSATSTESSTLRPWHFFVLAALVAATAGVFLVGDTTPPVLILLSAAIGAAALAGLGVYRTLLPLVTGDPLDTPPLVGGRTRAALEREKMLVLRAIKELEFDRAMGKVSESDFEEMGGRLRRRAIGLMRRLDVGETDYRQMIAREVDARLARRQTEPSRATGADLGRPEPSPGAERAGAERRCADCETPNDADARFCKGCGAELRARADAKG